MPMMYKIHAIINTTPPKGVSMANAPKLTVVNDFNKTKVYMDPENKMMPATNSRTLVASKGDLNCDKEIPTNAMAKAW